MCDREREKREEVLNWLVVVLKVIGGGEKEGVGVIYSRCSNRAGVGSNETCEKGREVERARSRGVAPVQRVLQTAAECGRVEWFVVNRREGKRSGLWRE